MSSSTTESLADITMPQMGVSVAEGTVTAWHKRPGDHVERDEPLLEISTDKVETDVPSPAAGRLVEILVEEGRTVDIGALLGRIEPAAAGGDSPAQAPSRGDIPGEAPSGNGSPAKPASETEEPAPPVSPVVRRIAAEHSVDIDSITGTGRRGRVTKRDILASIEATNGNGGGSPRPLHTESPYVEERTEREPPGRPEGEQLSVMRRQIGEHMVRSLHTAAHCTTVVEADMSAVEAARGKLSYLPYVARAAIDALREHPRLNATLDGDRMCVHEAVHLGVAVALGEDGLIVPVVRDAHELSVEGLAARIADLASRARERTLDPGEVGGATFTITNPGRYGALLATPIINQPQVAILDLEAVVKRAVVVSDADGRDSLGIRPMTYLCMSWDHRALDGVQAAEFLAGVRTNIERSGAPKGAR